MKSIYKADRTRIEDAIIPSLLEALMLMHLRICTKNHYKWDLLLLRHDIDKLIVTASQRNRLIRLEKAVLMYFDKNKWPIAKDFMAVTHLARSLVEAEALEFGKATNIVLRKIDRIIGKGYKEDVGFDVEKVDTTVIKQVPKVLRILQKEGYF